MTSPAERSIFSSLYEAAAFSDRFPDDPDHAVDVIIPVMHTNELWQENLRSVYREIPVNRLILSDDGCIDDSIELARKFPRVLVLDHRNFVTLGYSLRKLIEAVETEWFVYLHSDVYLAPGWFEPMVKARASYDWFESRQRTVILADVPVRYGSNHRPYSGAQMGRRSAFEDVLPRIDDDYLYRNEDIIIAHLLGKAGGRYGRVDEALIYHQQMYKRSRWQRDIEQVNITVRKSAEEELREKRMQIYGILKYMEPDPVTFRENGIIDYIYDLRVGGGLDWAEFLGWVEKVNPGWLVMIRKERNRRRIKAAYYRVMGPWFSVELRLRALAGRFIDFISRTPPA